MERNIKKQNNHEFHHFNKRRKLYCEKYHTAALIGVSSSRSLLRLVYRVIVQEDKYTGQLKYQEDFTNDINQTTIRSQVQYKMIWQSHVMHNSDNDDDDDVQLVVYQVQVMNQLHVQVMIQVMNQDDIQLELMLLLLSCQTIRSFKILQLAVLHQDVHKQTLSDSIYQAKYKNGSTISFSLSQRHVQEADNTTAIMQLVVLYDDVHDDLNLAPIKEDSNNSYDDRLATATAITTLKIKYNKLKVFVSVYYST
jgi:hypothetical protein